MAIVLVAMQVPSYFAPVAAQAPPSAAAQPPGFAATYASQSADLDAARTDVGRALPFSITFTNTGTTTWTVDSSTQVDLAVCRSRDILDCNTISPNAAWNAGDWFSTTAFATSTQSVVAPGAIANFAWNATIPAVTATADRNRFDFYMALVLHATGQPIIDQVFRQTARLIDGTLYVVTTNLPTGTGSLDEMITRANGNPGKDTIFFAIDGPSSIHVSSQYPTITDPVVIDGTTQFGWESTPIVELDGLTADIPGVDGIRLGSTSGGSVIRGLVINRFTGWGVTATAGGGSLIAGSYIGTDVTGTIARGNGSGGISLGTPSYRIGTNAIGDPNLIAGNNGPGIDITNDAPSTIVTANQIGTAGMPNTGAGIVARAGGAQVIANAIVGNQVLGIAVASSGNVLDGNRIDQNGRGGVLIGQAGTFSESNNLRDNLIRNNAGPGVALVMPSSSTTDANIIQRGSITGNTGAGIELSGGANRGVLPPVITNVTFNVIEGPPLVVQGTAGPNATIQLYDDPGDEGERFLTAVDAAADGSWLISTFPESVDVPALIASLRSGARFLRATQTLFFTDLEQNNTSAFSAPAVIGGALVGTAECRFTNGETITTRLLGGGAVALLSGSAVVTQVTAGVGGAYSFTDLAPNAHYNVRYDGFSSDERRYQCGVDNVVTDAVGGGLVREPTPLLNRLNHLWFRPYHLQSGVPIPDVIAAPGVSTWYRITVRPNERLTIRLTNPPTDYTVLAFTDLFQVAKLLKQQGATLTSIRRLTTTQDRAAPDLDSPDLDSPDLDSPDLDSPDLDSPDLDSPDLDSPDLDSPDLDSPDLDSPDLDSPDLDSPDLDSAGNPVPASQEVASYGSVYVAAQRRGLRAFSANPGVVPETIVLNTRSYSGDVYIRVRPHGDLSSSDTFTISATREGGEGCISAPLIQRAPLPQAFPAGPRRTLIVTNTAGAWFTAPGTATKAQYLDALTALATRAEVQGVVVDLANDTNIQQSFAEWQAATGKTCVAQANVVAQSIKQLVDLYRTQYGIEYLVLAGPDAAVPFFRVRDSAELSRESRYSGGLDALTPGETALVEDYVLTDAFYGAPGATTRSGHDFYISELGIGRLVESRDDILSYLAKYTAANGRVVVQSALSTGYGFLSDLASSTQASLAKAGANVTSLNNDTWSADDLRGLLLGTARYQFLSLQGHGRSNRLVPANDGPRFLASEIKAVNDGRFDGTLVFSIACHLEGYNLQDPDVLAGNDRVSFPEAFLASGATAVGVSGFGYGHYPLLKNGEVVFADLADEISFTADLNGVAYGARGVPLGKALNIAKLRFLNSLADVRGIEAKVINETMIYGLPMFAVATTNTFSRPPSASIVVAIAALSQPGLYVGQVAQGFTLHSHTLGAGTFFDAGTLDDTATIPLRPIVPAKNAVVQATTPGGADAVPRGAVLFAADYQDTPGFVPVLAVPATQDGLSQPPTRYRSTAFAPGRLVRLNEYAGDTAVFIPFQYQGQGASGIARTFSSITARFYYSTLTGDAALVDAPTIQSVVLARGTNGRVNVTATVAARTIPEVQEVFATYTATAGPLVGHWKSITLTASTTLGGNPRACITIAGSPSCPFTRTYTGTIDPADGTSTAVDPLALLVDVQAVGGNALVSYAANGGLHYRIVDQTATASTPKRSATLTLSAPPTVTYRSRFSVGVYLVDTALPPSPIVGKTIFVKFAGSFAAVTTDAAGNATANLVANAPPNPAPRLPYHITASLPEDIDVLAAPAEVNVVVTSGPTQLSPVAGVAVDYSDSAVVAQLLLSSRAIGLQDQPITIDLGAAGKVVTYTDRNGNVRLDTLDFGGLAPGTYSGTLAFKGENSVAALSRFAPSTTAISLVVRPETATIKPKMKPQVAGSVRLSATLTQSADGSLGDFGRALVHYVVRNQLGGQVAEGTTAATAVGDGTGTWSALVNLSTGVFTVDLDVRGSFTSPVTTSSPLAVFESRSASAGAGIVFAGANARGVPPGSKMLFAYVLRYLTPGSTLPVGIELTLFKPSQTTFLAISFDWLVVTKAGGISKAEFAGTGFLNGQSGWSFRAIATTAGDDGTFELRIWKASAGETFASPHYLVSGPIDEGGIFIR